MAYLSKNLSVLAYANGFTLWHYTTPDTLTEIDRPGYFNRASEMFYIGDRIMVCANTDATSSGELEFADYNVCMNAGGNIGLRKRS